MTKEVRDILGPDRDSEFLQSFVRIDLKAEPEQHGPKYLQKPSLPKQLSDKSDIYDRMHMVQKSPATLARDRQNKFRQGFEEVYTDKDRAAAVSAGSYDIKQSLSLKRLKDQSEALQLPTEVEPGTLIALGNREIKTKKYDSALSFYNKALEMNSEDSNALVARSRCYILLGESTKALEDAETALAADKNNSRAIYQKAEALYYQGQFEHSLMFFHRGLRLRPELASFRLGVQKTQEAIENTIGAVSPASKLKPIATPKKIEKPVMKKESVKSSQVTFDGSASATAGKGRAKKGDSRKLLGGLSVDKEYLEKLLQNPNLTRPDTGSEKIFGYAKDAVVYLDNCQEFWRQQRPCTAMPAKSKTELDLNSSKWS